MEAMATPPAASMTTVAVRATAIERRVKRCHQRFFRCRA
jgi:hypothetical protein